MAALSTTSPQQWWLAAFVVLGAVLAGCSSASTDPGNGDSVAENPDTRIVLGATATANEPAVTLPDALTEAARDAVSRGIVQLTAYAGSTSAKPVLERDISVYYNKAEREIAGDQQSLQDGFERNIEPVRTKLTEVQSTTPELDLLGLLGVLAKTPSPATLFVQSSGLQTTGMLDMRAVGSELDVERTLAKIDPDRLPDLSGKKVVFIGLGQEAGPQPRLTESMQRRVRELWVKVCEKAHGECDPTVHNTTGGKPRSTTPVPTIPVIADETVVVSGAVTTVTLPTGALFEPESAVFLDGAPLVLNGVVHHFRAAPGVEPVSATAVGHTATWGEKEGAVTTSKQRASKVVDYLVGTGVERALFQQIDGVGYTPPLFPDLDAAGQLIPEAAEKNRTVVLTVTHRRRS